MSGFQPWWLYETLTSMDWMAAKFEENWRQVLAVIFVPNQHPCQSLLASPRVCRIAQGLSTFLRGNTLPPSSCEATHCHHGAFCHTTSSHFLARLFVWFNPAYKLKRYFRSGWHTLAACFRLYIFILMKPLRGHAHIT